MAGDHEAQGLALVRVPPWLSISTGSSSAGARADGSPYRGAVPHQDVVLRWRHRDELELASHGVALAGAGLVMGAVCAGLIATRPVTGIVVTAGALAAGYLVNWRTRGWTELRLGRSGIARSSWSPALFPFGRARPRARGQVSVAPSAVTYKAGAAVDATVVHVWPTTLATRIERRAERDGDGDELVHHVVWLGDGAGNERQLLVTPNAELAAAIGALLHRHRPG